MELTKEMKKTLAFINVATAIVIMCLTIWTALSLGFIGKDVAPLIIGGSDGPTAIWLATDNLNALYALPVLFCVLLIANAYALCKSTKKASTEA
ncbi:MAG: hypothetical protein PHS50_09380 [Kiritimatiellae bacterium]|jgi:Na+-transporting methylmalonyl-CoA/oxaloacetate decarboxylase beta subunit|nr:hypothetical protein [Kiritimatiellia bacterium]